MAFMEWDNTFSTGIAEIDHQHMEIIALINQLCDGLKRGENKIRIEEILKKLINHSEIHFKTEEDLFEKYKYPQFLEHQVEHNRFGVIIMQFHQDYIDGRLNAPLQIIDFITAWLKNHILSKDQEYVPYLLEKMKSG